MNRFLLSGVTAAYFLGAISSFADSPHRCVEKRPERIDPILWGMAAGGPNGVCTTEQQEHPECESEVIEASEVRLIEVEGHKTVIQSWCAQSCSKQTEYQVATLLNSSGPSGDEFRVYQMKYPGCSVASQKLQQEIIQRLTSCERTLRPKCQAAPVIAKVVKPMDHSTWVEQWSVESCGARYDYPVTLTLDANFSAGASIQIKCIPMTQAPTSSGERPPVP